MATARVATGSIFGAVNSAATSVGATFDTFNTAIGMGQAFVTTAAKQQTIRNKVQSVDYTKRIIQECAVATATREREILNITSKDTDFKKLYDENVQLYSESLKDED